MNEVNKTLFIPLYGKAQVSKQGIILHDPKAVQIWDAEAFPIRGKSKSRWLTYNMAMRARVFDDWTCAMLRENPDALVLHIGCGLDSRCCRVTQRGRAWLDCDFPEVIALRRKYYSESPGYSMRSLNAARAEDIQTLPDASCAVVVLEGLCMYLSPEQLQGMLRLLSAKYSRLQILMDVYTRFGASASRYKNPVNDVGVTTLYGVDDLPALLEGTRLRVVREHSFTPEHLVNQLRPAQRRFFRFLFTGALYRKFYRLFELSAQ